MLEHLSILANVSNLIHLEDMGVRDIAIHDRQCLVEHDPKRSQACAVRAL